MAAMTLDPASRGQVNIPAGVLPELATPSPERFIVGQSVRSVIKCRNVAFGSRFQITGVDSSAATWLSPSTIIVNWTAGGAGVSEAQVISPEGRASNKIRLVAV
jgi:hypothetical protein